MSFLNWVSICPSGEAATLSIIVCTAGGTASPNVSAVAAVCSALLISSNEKPVRPARSATYEAPLFADKLPILNNARAARPVVSADFANACPKEESWKAFTRSADSGAASSPLRTTSVNASKVLWISSFDMPILSRMYAVAEAAPLPVNAAASFPAEITVPETPPKASPAPFARSWIKLLVRLMPRAAASTGADMAVPPTAPPKPLSATCLQSSSVCGTNPLTNASRLLSPDLNCRIFAAVVRSCAISCAPSAACSSANLPIDGFNPPCRALPSCCVRKPPMIPGTASHKAAWLVALVTSRRNDLAYSGSTRARLNISASDRYWLATSPAF